MSDYKTIVVLEQDLTVDYVGGALDGIRDFYKDKNVKLIITHTMLPGIEYLDLGYQYWTMTSILDNESVDGYIVLSGSYSSKLGIDELSSLLAPFTNPAISTNSMTVGIISFDLHKSARILSLSSGTVTTPTFGSMVQNG